MGLIAIVSRSGAAEVITTWQSNFVRVDQIADRSGFVGLEWSTQVSENQRLRFDWFLQFTASRTVSGTYAGGQFSGNQAGILPILYQPVAEPPVVASNQYIFREQTEEAGGAGLITHYNANRRFWAPTSATVGVATGTRLRVYFPMVVQHQWVRVNCTVTEESAAVGDDLALVVINAFSEGYGRFADAGYIPGA